MGSIPTLGSILYLRRRAVRLLHRRTNRRESLREGQADIEDAHVPDTDENQACNEYCPAKLAPEPEGGDGSVALDGRQREISFDIFRL